MSESALTEQMSKRLEMLAEQLELSDQNKAQFNFAAPRGKATSRTRGFVEVEATVRDVINLIEQFAPYVSLVLFVAQALFSRKVRDQLMVQRVAGMLRERGLSEQETVVIKNAAAMELSRLGLAEDKAQWGAAQVVQILAETLPVGEPEAAEAILGTTIEKIEEQVSCLPGWGFEKRPYGCSVSIPLPDDRRHLVHVFARGKDTGGEIMVEFQSVCGKVTPGYVEKVLRKSSRLELGSYTIRQSKGIDYFILQHRIRLGEVSEKALTRILPYLAAQGDELEEELYPESVNRF